MYGEKAGQSCKFARLWQVERTHKREAKFTFPQSGFEYYDEMNLRSLRWKSLRRLFDARQKAVVHQVNTSGFRRERFT
jgi:hypothetical protein